MGYKQRVIPLDFSELGEGCSVVIKNPALLPLIQAPSIPDGIEGEALKEALLKAMLDRVASVIVEWKMWDTTAEGDVELPLPSVDPTVLERCPSVVLDEIARQIRERQNPLRPPVTPTTKS